MVLAETTLTFAPPDWPVVLSAVAWTLLATEAILLVRRIAQGRPAVWAVGLSAAALLAGPLLALGGLLFCVMTAATGQPLRGGRPIRAGLRGSAVALLAWGVWRYGPAGAVVALAGVASFWTIRAYRRTTRPLPARTRGRLIALRIAAVALAALWVLDPQWQSTELRETPKVVLVGLDRSGSMARRDCPPDYRSAEWKGDSPPVRRLDAVRQALADQADELRALARQADVQWYAFDESPVVLPAEGGAPDLAALEGPPGPATAIGDCAKAMFDPPAAHDRKVAGVIILTDGCNNASNEIDPEDFAARLGARGAPIWAVGVGSEKVLANVRSLSVRSCGAPRQVEAFGRMTVRPVLETVGLQGKSIRVACDFGKTNLGRKTLSIERPQESHTLEFSYVPLETGFHRLIVTAEVVGQAPPGLAGQSVADSLVQVTDREIRVLYVEGAYRYETKYITQALATFGRVTLHRRIFTQPLRRGQEPPLGKTLDEWLRYHAFIFGDVAADQFTPEQLEILKRVVGEYGKGFAMIGGRRSFGDGGWAGTRVADILPVDLRRSRGQIDRTIRLRPTEEGEKSELMRIGPPGMSATEAWAKLDPLPGANVLAGVKPAATVLAETDRGEPMIVAQTYGKGRTLAVAFDTTWRWVLSPGQDDTAELQRRFWRQVALYLAAPKGNVWIHTNQTTYDLEALKSGLEEVEITAGVEDPSGEPILEAKVKASLTDPTGRVAPVDLPVGLSSATPGQPVRRAVLPAPRQVGLYTLEISSEVGGKLLSASQQFQVARRDRESAEVLADFSLLRRMAAAGGGRFVPLRRLRLLLLHVRRSSLPEQRSVTTQRDILGPWRWAIVLTLIALLCGEWIMRRRKGMV